MSLAIMTLRRHGGQRYLTDMAGVWRVKSEFEGGCAVVNLGFVQDAFERAWMLLSSTILRSTVQGSIVGLVLRSGIASTSYHSIPK